MNSSLYSSYATEIIQYWKFKETQKIKFCFKSPQLYLRKHLVEWLHNVSAELKMSYRTNHLCVYLLDTFMDRHSIAKERLGFVALVCLMLAAKFEEHEPKIPTISDLNRFDGFRYSNKDFISIEVMVLKCVDFELTQPTVAHFAEYYARYLVLPQDTELYPCVQQQSLKLIGEFLEICLKEKKFLRYRPSVVAAACMFATRYSLNLDSWTEQLQEATGYSAFDILSCVKDFLILVKENEEQTNRQVSPDSGYMT